MVSRSSLLALGGGVLVVLAVAVLNFPQISSPSPSSLTAQVAASGAANPDLYPTPADPNWPVVTLSGSAFPLTVSASQVAGIAVGTTYASWATLDAALMAAAPVIVQLPAGELGGEISGGRAGLCANIEWRGAVDATGYPLTGVSGTQFRCDARTDLFWTIKNLRIGPTDAQLAADPNFQITSSGIDLLWGGRLNVINVKDRNTNHNGVQSHTENEYLTRRTTEMWIYDSEIWGHGTQLDEHNIYVHSLKTFAFIRSVSRDTHGAHEIKADGDRLIVVDSVAAHVTYPGSPGINSGSAVVDISHAQDVFLARNLIVENTTGGTAGVKIVSRTNNNGGFSTKTPPIFDVENNPGVVRNGRWVSSPNGPASVTGVSGQVLIAASAGETSLQVGHMGAYGGGDPSTLSSGVNYTVRVFLMNGNVQEFTSMATDIARGVATFTVPGGLLAGAAHAQEVAIKKAGDAWDTPLLNSRFWNRSDPNYWWNQIRDASGHLDLTKQNLFNVIYLEDLLFLMNPTASSPVIYTLDIWQSLVVGTGRSEVPLPPLNNPQGPTAAWPDVPGAATFKEPLAGSGYPALGREPSGFVDAAHVGPVSDFIWPFPVFIADIGIWKDPASVHNLNQFQVAAIGKDTPATAGFVPDTRWLNGAGALVPVTTANPNPMPTGGQTMLSAAHATGVQTLTVASTAGCAVGQKIMVALPIKPGASRAIHISTIDQTPSGTTLHMADGLVRGAASGAAVVCFPKAGSRPSTWISPDHYADSSLSAPLPGNNPNPPPPPPPPVNDTTLPSTPIGLTGIAASAIRINLSWQASSDNTGVTGYKIFRNGTQISVTSLRTFSDTGLTASTAYSYTVSAYDAAGNTSAQSASISVTTSAPDVSSVAQFLRDLKVTGDFTVTSTCPDTLNVGQSCQITVTFKPLVAGQRDGTITFTDPISNQVRILILKGIGHTLPVVPPLDTTLPSTPASLAGVAASATQINLSWQASTDDTAVVGYKIFRNNTQVGTTAGLTFSNTGLTASTAYSYKIAAYDATGNTSTQSAAVSVTTGAASTVPTADLMGTSGDDALTILNGMHSVDGGAGYDTLTLAGSTSGPAFPSSKATDYTFTKNSDGSYTVRRGTSYTFTMVNIEKMVFPSGPALIVSDIQALAPTPSFFAWLWDMKTRIELAFQNLGNDLRIALMGQPAQSNLAAVVLSVSSDTIDFASTDLGSSATQTITLVLTSVPDAPPPVSAPAPTGDNGTGGTGTTVANGGSSVSYSDGSSAYTYPSSPSGGSSITGTPATTNTPSGIAPTFSRTLFQGASGEDVRDLQKFLNASGFAVTASGEETTFFGPVTALALARYQEAHRDQILTPNGLSSGTGILGPSTIAFIKGNASAVTAPSTTTTTSSIGLSRTVAYGYRGSDIATLQRYLIAHSYLAAGYDTGYFGALTRAAVRAFQCAQNIVCSGDETSTGYGLVGVRTRGALK